jgi:lantibiotic leader peptide-processing serine protease
VKEEHVKRTTSIMLAGLVGLSACSEDRVAPFSPETGGVQLSEESSFSIDELATTGKHIVIMGGQRLPGDLAARVAALGGTIEVAYEPIGIAVVAGLSSQAAATLQAFDDVSFVQRDLIVPMVDPMGGSVEAANAFEPGSHASPTAASFYARQWNMRAIGADQVWAAGYRGSSNVTVAILDTGLDYTAPDLAGRVDLSRSASFITWAGEDQLRNHFFPGMHEIVDMQGHGTHVGNTVVSNGHVVAGVTQNVTLIGVKVLSAAGSGATSGVLAGIMFAADQGADVINMSLGTRLPILKETNPGLPVMYNRAMNYAHRMGSVVVVSAGNENMDLDALDGYYKPYCTVPNTVCVSATGPTSGGTVGPWLNVDTKASYSNFGVTYVDVAAPGGNSGGSVWAACSKQRLTQSSTGWSRHTCSVNTHLNYVVGMSGTSMAAPHVSGLAALLVEQVGRRNPGVVRNRLHQSGDDLGEAGADPIYGKGRINVARAILR